MEEKNKNTVAKVLIIIAIVLIIVGILIALFKNHNDKGKIYYATFMVDGVEYQSNIVIENGYISRLPDQPKKEGYVFDHWEINGQEYTGTEKITSDATLIAVFKEVEKEQIVVITFNKDNGEENSTVEIIKNEKVTPIFEPKKEGYEFIGWYLNDEEYSFDTFVHENITLIAKWKISTFTINFDSKGGSKISSQEVEYKEKAESPKTPVRTGYKFLGWYLNNKKYDFNTMITKNITLIAKWEKVEDLKNIAYGDTNEDGEVNTRDSLKIAKYLDLGEKLTDQAKKNADVNADGKINHIDPILIAGYIAGYFDVELPDSPITEYTLYGDLNNDGLLTNDDYNKLRSYISNNASINEQAKKNADVNGNGKIDSIDLKNLKARLDKLDADDIKYNTDRTASLSPIVDYITYGDVNEDGKINDMLDVIELQDYLDGNIRLNDQAKKNADVNADGELNAVDVKLLLAYDTGAYNNTLPTSPIKDYVMYGDTYEEGIVDTRDSMFLKKYLDGSQNLNAQGIKNSDVNADGKVNNVDLILLDRYLADWYDNTLPDSPIKDYVMYGDVNEDGFVDGKDSIRLQNYIDGTTTLEQQAQKNADVNNDGKVNDTDYQLLLQYLVEVDDGKIPDNPLS